jgi:hypothetical protein
MCGGAQRRRGRGAERSDGEEEGEVQQRWSEEAHRLHHPVPGVAG